MKGTDESALVAPWIDGGVQRSLVENSLELINPSSGHSMLRMSAGCAGDVDKAVSSARNALCQQVWSEVAPSAKKQVLHRFAGLIERESGALDAVDARDMGKPVSCNTFNAMSAAGLMRFYAEAVDKILGDVLPSDRHSFVAQRRVPRGVVAAITPWNFPTFNTVLKVAPALAAGNCVVLKPSELSPRSALRLGELATEAGLPPGVFNIVPGLGETVGRALGLHNEVDMVTFTGSTEVGKLMLQYAGQSNMKVVMSECGGKCPQIVFDDGVDLDGAADSIAHFLLTNQGQICSVGSRLLVQSSIERRVVERLLLLVQNIKMGDALDPSTTFGPLASAAQCARVMGYIRSARDSGARLVTGGNRVRAESGGYFVEPTVFGQVPRDSRIAQEEIFGPVLAVIPFENEAEAIEIANATVYGLAAYVWTSDLSRGMRMAKSLRSSVWINGAPPAGEGPGHAFSSEPAQQSGVGIEGGLGGLESYLRRQLVWINHS